MSSTNPARLAKLQVVVAVVIALIINTGVASASVRPIDGPESNECPASLVTLGKDYWDQIPEFPRLNWDFELPVKISIIWNSFLNLIDLILPGISNILPQSPNLDWVYSWLPAGWFEEESLTSVPVINQVTGTVIGLVPIVGPLVDGTAIITAKDQVTGECISRMSQGVLLASAGATMALPVLLPLRVGLKVGKPLAKLLPDIPVTKLSNKLQSFVDRFNRTLGLEISKLVEVNEVSEAYQGMLKIVGKRAVSPNDLAKKLELNSFTENNYREGLMRLTGRKAEEVQGLEAHHILPREFEESFLNAGIENIHDPRLLVWVEKGSHQQWSPAYSDAWREFLNDKQNPTVDDILEEAHKLAKEFDYPVSYEVPAIRLPDWVRLPFVND